MLAPVMDRAGESGEPRLRGGWVRLATAACAALLIGLVLLTLVPMAAFVPAGANAADCLLQSISEPAGLSLLAGLVLATGLFHRSLGRAEAAHRQALIDARQGAARLERADALTGLLNRRALSDAYAERLMTLRHRDIVLTLLLIDIDHFKGINDGDGHECGDRVLVRLAGLLKGEVRGGDVVGRLGGDEFLLILTAPRYQSPGEVLGERLLQQVLDEPEFRATSVPVTLSIGLATVWQADTGFSTALKQADLALNEAKRDGRGRLAHFRPVLSEQFDRRKSMMIDVRRALDAGDIVPAYQPVLSLADRSLAGVEVLARWRKAGGELLEASRFAAVFEEPTLATAISEAMMRAAATDCGFMIEKGIEFGRVALNVTEAQMADPDFAERLLDTLLAEDLSPKCLTVELVESVLLSRREARILKTLEQLSAAGVMIALDDFGTGFASLNHLRRFPVDRIKLDLSFTSNITEEPDAHAIVSAMIGMAHELGIGVVAEGVQTAETDAMLRSMGCDYGQGYFYARPQPFERVRQLLARGLAA